MTTVEHGAAVFRGSGARRSRQGRRCVVAVVSAAVAFAVAGPTSIASAADICLPETLPTRVVTSFVGGTDGTPQAGGAVFRDGVLYGTTGTGGDAGGGSVYRLAPPVAPSTVWTRTKIAQFRGGSDGRMPSSGLGVDGSGALYGVTYMGGGSDLGTVYQLLPPVPPATAWPRKILHAFTGGADGSRPVDELAMDGSGALYGVLLGGSGAVFRLVPPATGNGPWKNEIIYTFQGGADGSMPRGPLVVRNGELFGVTHDMGDTGRGTVFRLTRPVAPATTWTKTVIHRFPGVPNSTWSLPSRLVFDTAGALYGATQQGGPAGYGTVFRLTRSIWPEWTYTLLYGFKGGTDSRNPSSGLVFDGNGALIGATAWGGTGGFGTIYRLTPPVAPATEWTETIVHSFAGGTADGATPISSVLADTGGAFYGVTSSGGAKGMGTVYRLAR